ncbi:C-type lectin domain family 2 member B [Rhinolophus ferrumequinum]|uniref:C-type lectin domain family 2 member B n=2 Tax=Rhinolophus ferrumequinum TaxID=59479 RepID=A0A7J7WPA7_RHIFE|nr:C-type lectin domain family 2 member B [Rhinolophus ferrumequinum]
MTQSIPLATLSGSVPNTDNSNQGSDETKRGVNKKYMVYILALFTLLVISFIANIVVPIVIVRPLLVTQYFCPDDWIRFQDSCYYFSKQEENWNSSRYNCSTQHADLTMIDTMEEMNFLTQYKCTSDHWIGLTMTKNQTRQWVNGTIFNKWFDVKGNGKCAYLGDDGVATARCYTERKWICRKKKGTW